MQVNRSSPDFEIKIKNLSFVAFALPRSQRSLRDPPIVIFIAAMASIIFTLVAVLLPFVSGTSSKQSIDVGHPVIWLLNASASVAISQVQVSLQSQEPFSSTNQVIKLSPGAKSNGTIPRSTFSTMIGNSTGSPIGVTGMPNPEATVSAGAIMPAGIIVPVSVTALLPTTVQSFQTATTTPLINDSTLTPSSEIHSTVVGTETASCKTKLTDSPITPSLGANSLGQSNISGQTLTPGAVATVSGTIISIPPKESDKVAANCTNVPSTNTTTGSTSGPARTSVQVFNGGVLGGRHGLSTSSIVLLVGIVVLLWL